MTERGNRILRRVIVTAVLLAILAAGTLAALDYIRRHPENVPWTELDLGQPIGTFTGRKLTALREDRALCLSLLERAGIDARTLPPHDGGPQCAYDDAVQLRGGEGRIALRPANVGLSCPIVAAFAIWVAQIVQPAAERHFGSRVTAIEHFGGYSCRRIGGREQADWSEHATANALDIAAFRLADGRRISVLEGWRGDAAEQTFLREVRDGACQLYATVLSPDYNEAHRDHLHFDQAQRGARGWRGCR